MVIILHIFILLSLAELLYSRYKNYRKLTLVFKPITIILIFGLSFLYLDWSLFPEYGRFITYGLFFSIFGDIFLMFEKQFKLGMLSFLFAHIFYIQAVLLGVGFQIGWLGIFCLGIWLYFRESVLPILSASLKIPVMVYSLVLTFLVWQSAELVYSNPIPYTTLFLGGIILFAASDWILIVNKYLRNKWEPLKLPLYFIGQLLIAWSIIYHC